MYPDGYMPRPKSDLERFNMFLPAWLLAAMRACACDKGVTMTEYVKDAVKEAVRKDNERNGRR